MSASTAQLHGSRAVEVIDLAGAFRRIAAVADVVPTFILERPDDLSSVTQVVDEILAATP